MTPSPPTPQGPASPPYALIERFFIRAALAVILVLVSSSSVSRPKQQDPSTSPSSPSAMDDDGGTHSRLKSSAPLDDILKSGISQMTDP
ncbi:hypothetical protein K457DRAFT_21717 [Linnemannia elongata AG-77]|uniref:Uncharacterized protein n=1 Tax=Linnemannia elongata AG-77 TaxID=1314771 RepID=A0A197JRF0_9FUNG|nr:hypothetical protein K457DRAFT_21717 [Linnemannia elongata AG-77]